MTAKKRFPGLMDMGKKIRDPEKMRKGFKFLLLAPLRFATLPVIRKFHPWTRPDKTHVYWLPVNKHIEQAKNAPVPYDILAEFIKKASTRMIMNTCGCRRTYECRHYPKEIGCLIMGDEAKMVDPDHGKIVSEDEALRHIRRAEAAGLPAVVGKARVDNFIYGVPDVGRMLSVCFCCDCCCFIGNYRNLPAAERNKIVHRLEGLKVTVDHDKCTGCGKCSKHCFMNLIEIRDEKAHISDDCYGCGRCASNCKQGAIHISLESPDFKDKAIKNIEAYVKL